MKTYSAKKSDISRQWYLIDATQASLGRVASVAAGLLLGKSKASLTPHLDGGDYVIIINASKTKVTGNKLAAKTYHRHSGYPSGLSSTPLKDSLVKDPTFALKHAIRGMLPDNKLRSERLKRLKIYPGAEHSHDPQQPTTLDIKDLV